MKKFLTTTMLLLAAMVIPANAQSFKFGIKGGLNISDMSFDEKVLETSNKTGFFIGPTVQVALPIVGLGVDISGLYDQKESKVNDETIKQQSILVPVNLRYKFGLGSQAGIYLAAGPQFGFNVGDDKYTWNSITDISGTQQQIANEFQLKKSNFSVNLGAGVYLTKHIEVGFQYNIPLGKTADATVGNAVTGTAQNLYKSDDTKVKTWSISAALFF